MPLLMQIFHDLSDKNEDFWFKIAPFFSMEIIPAGTVLWKRGVTFRRKSMLNLGRPRSLVFT
jgi:SulP family sulfate permease